MMRSRNWRVRGCAGDAKTLLGWPLLEMRPRRGSRPGRRPSRAKAISCVAMTIVMPPSASKGARPRAPRRRAPGRGRSSPRRAGAAMGSSRARARSRRAAAGRPRAGPGTRLPCRRARSARGAPTPRRSASAVDTPSAFRGASVTLSSTLMCGKRLNAWKTMPMPRRTRLTSTRASVITLPVRADPPASTCSRRLTQRRSVDLPEPEAPMRQTTSCTATSRSMPRSTATSPNASWTDPRAHEVSSPRTARPGGASRCSRSSTRYRSAGSSGIVTSMNISAVTRNPVKLK